MNGAEVDVRFVVTPFLPEFQPALGVSSLSALLQEHGIKTDIAYLNICYQQLIGKDLYHLIGEGLPPEFLLGEMIFSRALWGDSAPSWQDYTTRLMADCGEREQDIIIGNNTEPGDCESATLIQFWQQFKDLSPDDTNRDHVVGTFNRLHEIYRDAQRQIIQWADRVMRGSPRVIGFTTTFQQNLASLALAKELRRRHPKKELKILFGGANCEGEMGRVLSESFPFIDHVVSGEAEHVIVSLVNGDADATVGETRAGQAMERYLVAPSVCDMDELPVPTFDDYFTAIKDTGIDSYANLVAESSRGCWWGAKSHCTFCGLNGNSIGFRSKSPARFVEEIVAQKDKYGPDVFLMTDNILDLKYISSLFPKLIEGDANIKMFYETKSNLKKPQLAMLAAGGVAIIQPGIESLIASVLKLMRKGTTALQNIQLLKWCEEYRVRVRWNFLCGFPGEEPEEYARTAEIMPRLFHLQAPIGVFPIRMDRFSPNWETPEAFGISDVRPCWAYEHAYAPLSPVQRNKLAYFFEFDYQDGRNPREYVRDCVIQALDWRKAYANHCTLSIENNGSSYWVRDTRSFNMETVVPISTIERELLLILDAAVNLDTAYLRLIERSPEGRTPTPSEFSTTIEKMRSQQWIVEEDGKALSIVLNREEFKSIRALRTKLKLNGLGLGFFAETCGEPDTPSASIQEPVSLGEPS